MQFYKILKSDSPLESNSNQKQNWQILIKILVKYQNENRVYFPVGTLEYLVRCSVYGCYIVTLKLNLRFLKLMDWMSFTAKNITSNMNRFEWKISSTYLYRCHLRYTMFSLTEFVFSKITIFSNCDNIIYYGKCFNIFLISKFVSGFLTFSVILLIYSKN